MTGLTDAMRSDMNVKKELSSHTRLSPEQRYQQLQAIVDQIRSNERANKFIEDWGLELQPDLSSVSISKTKKNHHHKF
jgi:hypothetical protein